MVEFELKKRIEILEGEVKIYNQEVSTGYCSPILMIGDVDFTEWFEYEYYMPPGNNIPEPGKFRITVEKIE